jgi:hypothetical protein
LQPEAWTTPARTSYFSVKIGSKAESTDGGIGLSSSRRSLTLTRHRSVEATDFEIPDHWPRPILMLYDAHDGGISGKIISRHAIAKWFPKLVGQTVAIHDCLVVSPDFVLPAERFAKAMHWSGRCIAGFGEVQHLVEWMNREHIDFWRPGDELEQLGLAGSDSCLIALTLPA